MDIKKNLRNKLSEVSNNVLYCALVLPEESKQILLSNFKAPDGWAVYADHVTIAFGKSLEDVRLEQYDGDGVIFRVTDIGQSETAIAVKVEFKNNRFACIESAFPHITLFVNKKAGGRPVDSNKITDWAPVKDKFIYLKGIVSNVTK
jgi:hypothetical protein